ncbi:MAG TPA: hypothetical protein EYH56_01530 [Nanoarchaeota archaeon]|nr:hypothetical protein [Nanoarchaeota archaeon]
MKALSPLLSGVLYTGIAIVGIVLAMNILSPIIEQMKDKAAFEQAQSFLLQLDKVIQDVAKEGKYATRVITLDFSRGKYIIDNETNTIEYILETEAKLVSPGTMRKIGNVIITSGRDVKVEDLGNVIRMSNSYLVVNFTKLGNETNFVDINLSKIISEIKVIRENAVLSPEVVIKFNEIETGKGYIKAEQIGEKLPYGRVIAHISTKELEFDIVFTLKSYSDFIIIEAENVKVIS